MGLGLGLAELELADARDGRGEDSLEPGTIPFVLRKRLGLREHVEGCLIPDPRLLGVGHGVAPPLHEGEHRRARAQVDEPRVEVAVQQRVACIARQVDAVCGDGDVGLGPRRLEQYSKDASE